MVAQRRLSAIREFTEFGAGFQVAQRDLEIRGAGNVLGASQHGHMASVGYDMYMKLLNEAVLEEKGEIKAPKLECAVDLNVNAYIPDKYIRITSQRIDIYKKIALIETNEDLMDITDELLDRYGDMPKCVEELLKVSLLRKVGSNAGMSKIERRASNVLIYPYIMNAAVWTRIAAENKGKVLLNMGSKPYVSCKIDKGVDIFAYVKEMLDKYIELTQENN